MLSRVSSCFTSLHSLPNRLKTFDIRQCCKSKQKREPSFSQSESIESSSESEDTYEDDQEVQGKPLFLALCMIFETFGETTQQYVNIYL